MVEICRVESSGIETKARNVNNPFDRNSNEVAGEGREERVVVGGNGQCVNIDRT